MTHLVRLIDHLAWADERTLAALRGAPRPDASVVDLYAHILGAECEWLARIEGRKAEAAVWPKLTLEECAALAGRNAAALRAFVAGLGAADLGRQVTYRNSAGLEFTSTVEDILLHVALHGAYHRGQVARALREGGAVPNATDYIAFIRGAPAARR
ncbi:MAG TPA: DinB family protein [Gemmatimonadales bacterium]|nr:DinB family protein [Gemmatimonadales bacterium]